MLLQHTCLSEQKWQPQDRQRRNRVLKMGLGPRGHRQQVLQPLEVEAMLRQLLLLHLGSRSLPSTVSPFRTYRLVYIA